MKLTEVLKDLTVKKKKDPEIYLCFHPEHKAVAEIIPETELDKWKEAEGGYEVLGVYPSRADAMDDIQSALLFAYEQDPSMKEVKSFIKNFFDKKSSDSNKPADFSEPGEESEAGSADTAKPAHEN